MATAPRYAEVPLAYAADANAAASTARGLFRFGLTGWKVQAELPKPGQLRRRESWVTAGHMREAFGCGPDLDRHLAVVEPFVEAGYDHLR